MSDKRDLYLRLAREFYMNRRYPEALAACRSAIRQVPEDPVVWNLLGVVQLAQNRPDDAIVSLSKAITFKRDLVDAWNNMGLALEEAGRPGEAVVAFQRALGLEPGHANALPQTLFLRQKLCHDWTNLNRHAAALAEGIRSGTVGSVVTFPLLSLPGLDASDHLIAARRYAQSIHGARLEAPPLAKRGVAHEGRLRIGYLSGDLRTHAVCQLVVGVLEAHDRARVEVSAYSYGPDDGSPMRTRVRNACEHFHDVQALPDEEVARRIAADRIDILVELTGYTTGCRADILARRPAPVQANWLGYPGTLGDRRMADYLIGDPIVTPPERAADYAETLALLPDCYQPNDRLATPSAQTTPATRASEGLPEQGVVFCCFNQAFKITPDVFDLWCQILHNVPGSVLWLLGPTHVVAVRNLFEEAARRGIDRDRVRFSRFTTPDAHQARLALADLSLDTFPYTSHTTGTDAIRAGVPLVTRIGTTFASRVAASLLHAVGMDDLVVDSPEAYVRLASDLGNDPARLGAIRQRLMDNRQTSAIFDPSRFARNLERLYERMWADHLVGRRSLIQPDPGAAWAGTT